MNIVSRWKLMCKQVAGLYLLKEGLATQYAHFNGMAEYFGSDSETGKLAQSCAKCVAYWSAEVQRAIDGKYY